LVLHHLLKKGDNVNSILFAGLDQFLHISRTLIPLVDPIHHFANKSTIQIECAHFFPGFPQAWAHITDRRWYGFLAT